MSHMISKILSFKGHFITKLQEFIERSDKRSIMLYIINFFLNKQRWLEVGNKSHG